MPKPKGKHATGRHRAPDPPGLLTTWLTKLTTRTTPAPPINPANAETVLIPRITAP